MLKASNANSSDATSNMSNDAKHCQWLGQPSSAPHNSQNQQPTFGVQAAHHMPQRHFATCTLHQQGTQVIPKNRDYLVPGATCHRLDRECGKKQCIQVQGPLWRKTDQPWPHTFFSGARPSLRGPGPRQISRGTLLHVRKLLCNLRATGWKE